LTQREGGPRPGASSVADFSEQWAHYTLQRGYFASEEMLRDYLGPLIDLDTLADQRVCEVGSGNGRFLRILAHHAAHVIGIEPSEAIHVSRKYTRGLHNVEHIQADIYVAEGLPRSDVVFCLGVLHHTSDAVLALTRIRGLLEPRGRAVIWVYGREGNTPYLLLARLLRIVTVRLPHGWLDRLSGALVPCLKAYVACCRRFPLPLFRYMRNVLGQYDDYALKLTIYDQLNPSLASYWSRAELEGMLASAGFARWELYHRHGYSWTALAYPP
jgi:SAM-dependent methyltransferase